MESPFISCQASSYTLTTSAKYNKRSELKCREKSGHAKSTEWYYVLLCRCFSLGRRCVFMKSGIGGEWENSGLVNLVQERTLGTRLRSCERIYEVWARFLERWLILTQE